MKKLINTSLIGKTLLLGMGMSLIIVISSLSLFGRGVETLPLHVATEIIIFAIFLLIFFVAITILLPLSRITREMIALLTGDTYKHVYINQIDEIGIIAHFFNKITGSLEKASQEIKERRRIASELEIAKKIQRNILPETSPRIPYLDIVAKTKSAVEIGGDAFNFIDAKDNNKIIYIGDMTGHGIPAGLGMVTVNALMKTFGDMFDNAYEIIMNTNKYLKPLIQSTMFMTMAVLRWHQTTQSMYYVGAGHESIIHIKNKTHKVNVTRAGGIALGMVTNISHIVKEIKLDFEPFDVLILYTDGVTEAKNIRGERLGLNNLTEIIKNIDINYSADEIFRNISSAITTFIQNTTQEDDMTLMVIKRLPA